MEQIPPPTIKCASVASKEVVAKKCGIPAFFLRSWGALKISRGGCTPPVETKRAGKEMKIKGIFGVLLYNDENEGRQVY
jgi:hypothetical protein